MIVIEQNAPLNQLHTFRLPGVARVVHHLRDKHDCAKLPTDNYLVIGHGSNTIFTTDFERPLVRIELSGIDVQESASHWLLTAAAGESWHQLVTYCLHNGYYGFENLALIPGTVGAAPVQNIGAYGCEVADFISSVEAWDREQRCLVELSHNDCQFAYRDSIFKQTPERWLITEVRFRLPKVWQANTQYAELSDLVEPTATDIYQRVVAVRERKLPDPQHIPNAGSFFKNPTISIQQYEALLSRHPNLKGYPNTDGSMKVAAGWLIDQRGWKSANRGAIQVHQQQALVLVNAGGGTGNDLVALAAAIKDDIQQHFAIGLEVEVRLFNQRELIQL
jgi:UDP-N-acetylmuramate dehydrogenase